MSKKQVEGSDRQTTGREKAKGSRSARPGEERADEKDGGGRDDRKGGAVLGEVNSSSRKRQQ